MQRGNRETLGATQGLNLRSAIPAKLEGALFPYTTLLRSGRSQPEQAKVRETGAEWLPAQIPQKERRGHESGHTARGGGSRSRRERQENENLVEEPRLTS